MGLDGLHSIDPDPTPIGRGAGNYQIETFPPPTRAPAGPVKFGNIRAISRKARQTQGQKDKPSPTQLNAAYQWPHAVTDLRPRNYLFTGSPPPVAIQVTVHPTHVVNRAGMNIL